MKPSLYFSWPKEDIFYVSFVHTSLKTILPDAEIKQNYILFKFDFSHNITILENYSCWYILNDKNNTTCAMTQIGKNFN